MTGRSRSLVIATPMLCLLAALLVLPGLSAVSKKQTVLFEGRNVSQWLDQGFEDASRALHELGPLAVSDVLAKVRLEHPQFGYWARYRFVWAKIPARGRNLLPRPKVASFDEWRACNALVAIGPRAIPPLTLALEDHHWLVRSTSAQALALLKQQGADIGAANHVLVRALRDRNEAVRRYARMALTGKA